MSDLFTYHVRDKDGRIEIYITKAKGKPFKVCFPSYEAQNIMSKMKYKDYAMMEDYQVGMMIFCYSKSEFEKFEKVYEQWRLENGWEETEE